MTFTVGQVSEAGCKATNQDCHGAHIPAGAALRLKGAAFAIADGISSSPVSHIASNTAVSGFINDYFCTSEAWSVERAATAVLNALNAWLYSEGRRGQFEGDRGYVCTFSAIVFKADAAHIFHIGDSRIYRLRNHALEQLTNDHRLVVSSSESYLSRALGAAPQVDIDYQRVVVNEGDVFILATDGVYDPIDPQTFIQSLESFGDSPDSTARSIVASALAAGSDDNLTLQIIRVDSLDREPTPLLSQELESLPFPPPLDDGLDIDGYRINRALYTSPRSHCHLATDLDTGERVVIKVPSVEQRADAAYLERFLLEEWIARRLDNPHIVKAPVRRRQRHYFYTVTEYLEGCTLAQWLIDHPTPDLTTVRTLVEQIARGLMAFHRKDMLHQDIRPENLIIDPQGTVKIIDFGSTRVAGLEESDGGLQQPAVLGTAIYTAPEYFLGEVGSVQSDLYSLAVLTYHMLCGGFPYGPDMAKARTYAAQRRTAYRSLLNDEREIPRWIDDTLKKALNPNPLRRYTEVAEFVADLKRPGAEFIARTRPPLIARNPVAFWQSLSLILLLIILLQAAWR